MNTQRLVKVSVYAQTDIGRVRQNNEDNFLIADLTERMYRTAATQDHHSVVTAAFNIGERGFLAAVSDGMGGALAGEVASHLAVNAVPLWMEKLQQDSQTGRFPFSEQFRLAVEQANKLIYKQSQSSPQLVGMGATFTGAAFFQGQLYLAQVGDSRAYVVRDNRIIQATKDQSLVEQLVEAGYLTEEQAREHAYKNVILQALGAQPDTAVIMDRLTVFQDDILVLCSDGLSNKVRDAEMLDILSRSRTLEEAGRRLIELANERGGEDNITAVICRFQGETLPRSSSPPSFDLERIERHEDLPLELTTIPFSADELLTKALEHSDHPSEEDIPDPQREPDDDPASRMNARDDNPRHSERTLERYIAHLMIGILILIFLGAVWAVAWYLKIREEGHQERPEPSAHPMARHKPFLPLTHLWTARPRPSPSPRMV